MAIKVRKAINLKGIAISRNMVFKRNNILFFVSSILIFYCCNASAVEYGEALAAKTRIITQNLEISDYKELPFIIPGWKTPVGLDVSFTLTQHTPQPSADPILLYLYLSSPTDQRANRDVNCQPFDDFSKVIDMQYRIPGGQKSVRVHYRCLPWNVNMIDKNGDQLSGVPLPGEESQVHGKETLDFSLYLDGQAFGPNSQDLTSKLIEKMPVDAHLLDSSFWHRNIELVRPDSLKNERYSLCSTINAQLLYCRQSAAMLAKKDSIEISHYEEAPVSLKDNSQQMGLAIHFHVKHTSNDTVWIALENLFKLPAFPMMQCRSSGSDYYSLIGVNEVDLSYECTAGLPVQHFSDKTGIETQHYLQFDRHMDAPRIALLLYSNVPPTDALALDITDKLTGQMKPNAKLLSFDFWQHGLERLEAMHPIDNNKLIKQEAAQKAVTDAEAAEQKKLVSTHLKLTKPSFFEGEPIGLKLTVDNKSSKDIHIPDSDYPFWFGGNGIKFNTQRTTLEAKPDEDCWGCGSHMFTQAVIKPGQIWTTTIYLQDFLVKPPMPGKYSIDFSTHLGLTSQSNHSLEDHGEGTVSFTVIPKNTDALEKLFFDYQKSYKREEMYMDSSRMNIVVKALGVTEFASLAAHHDEDGTIALGTLSQFPKYEDALPIVSQAVTDPNEKRVYNAISVLTAWKYPLDKATVRSLLDKYTGGWIYYKLITYLTAIDACRDYLECRCVPDTQCSIEERYQLAKQQHRCGAC